VSRLQFFTRFPVRKAAPRRPWRVTRTKGRMMALGRQMSRAVQVHLTNGLRAFKKRIDKEQVYQAWLSGNYNRVMEQIPWRHLPEDLEPYRDSLVGVAGKSGMISLAALPAPISANLRFDTKNPDIRDMISDNTARLAENIQEGTRQFIADAVARRFDEALSPRDVADVIRPSIGLNTRQVMALNNYRNMLEKKELPDARVEELTDAYHERLLDYRSMMIARTETRFAMNQGQLSVWGQAADQGLIDRNTAKKQWVTAPDACDLCQELEDQGPIPMDDSWQTDDGAIDAPPRHPNCYCDTSLVFQEEKTTEEEED